MTQNGGGIVKYVLHISWFFTRIILMADAATLTLLIIEDDASLATMYWRLFEKEGFKIIVAHDGEEGLKLAIDNTPSAILLDNLLPKINGLEVLGQLKKNEKTKSIPVLVLSNLAEATEKERALELGAKDYLTKAGQPPEEIVNRIKSYVGR